MSQLQQNQEGNNNPDEEQLPQEEQPINQQQAHQVVQSQNQLNQNQEEENEQQLEQRKQNIPQQMDVEDNEDYQNQQQQHQNIQNIQNQQQINAKPTQNKVSETQNLNPQARISLDASNPIVQQSKQMQIQSSPHRKPFSFDFSPTKMNKQAVQVIDIDSSNMNVVASQGRDIPRKASLTKSPITQPQAITSINTKQSYVNSLQIQLSKIRQNCTSLMQQKQNLQATNKLAKQGSKKLRFQILSLKQEVSKAQGEKQKSLSQIQKLNLKCDSLNQKLEAYKQVGDITLLKNKIQQLELMVKVQADELSLRTQMIDQKQQGNSQNNNHANLNKFQFMKEVQKMAFQNSELQEKNVNLQQNVQKNLVQILTLTSQLNNYKEEFQRQQQKSQQLSEKLKQLQEKLRQTESSNSTKLRHLEQKLIHALNMNISPQNQQEQIIPASKYGIKLLSLKQQKDILLKKYIELQIDNKKIKQKFTDLKEKYFNVVKQLKNLSSVYVNKKDHTELWNKYTKLRKCLENSIKNQENLKQRILASQRVQGNKSLVSPSINFQSKISQKFVNSLDLLEQKENPIFQIQALIESSKKSNADVLVLKTNLQEKQKISQLQSLLQKKQENMKNVQNQIKTSQHIIQIYQKDLKYKKVENQNLKYENENLSKKLSKALKKIQEIQSGQFSNESIRILKNTNELTDIKNLDLLNKNHYLKQEIGSWKQLYQTIKQKYQEFMKRQPYIQINNNKQSEMQEEGQIDNFICKKCQQAEQDIEGNISVKKVQTLNQILQTQGLAELYYKQIKQLLNILRKFPKKVDTFTSSLELQKASLSQIKRKYDEQSKAFKMKQKKLQEQKHQNDEWRLKQKQQIRQEYQQIRELILNNRLINAIRKAKSLIQYYQKEQEVEGEADGNNDNNQNQQNNNQDSDSNQNGQDQNQPQQKQDMEVEAQQQK